MPESILLPDIGDTVAGKYEVERLLGRGGMGCVYAARHSETQRLFALKLLSGSLSEDSEAKERFVREAKLAGAIDHPAVVRIYDIGHHGASLYMVMDLLRGESLSERLKRGPLPPAEAIRVMKGILAGVGAAHKKGIVHRDLKPDNIFLCKPSKQGPVEPRILDFGVSKALFGNSACVNGLTKTGEILGTPLYMSPEQVHGAKNIDERTDIYALGVILYQMLSGKLPFRADNFPGLILEIISGQAKPLSHAAPGITAELNDVVMRAMSVSQNERFANVESLDQAITPFIRDEEPAETDFSQTPARSEVAIVDTPTPFKTEIERTARTPGFFAKRSFLAISVFVAVAVLVGSAAIFLRINWKGGFSPSRVTHIAQPPPPGTIRGRVQADPLPVVEKPTRKEESIMGRESVDKLPSGMTAPQAERRFFSNSDRTKSGKTTDETAKNPPRPAESKQRHRRESAPVEEEREPKALRKPTTYEIEDDKIIDPFEQSP
ncbi:MAG: serine/threonine protein kinase [Deltaproteobacteria bacterium]|nr:serine/threonine protein kinase [Deltaproteobacteria bacterium]